MSVREGRGRGQVRNEGMGERERRRGERREEEGVRERR